MYFIYFKEAISKSIELFLNWNEQCATGTFQLVSNIKMKEHVIINLGIQITK